MRRRYLLAADVGGTKVALALAAAGGARPEIVAHRVYACQEFDGLQPIIAKFLQQPPVAEHREAIAGACFSVAATSNASIPGASTVARCSGVFPHASFALACAPLSISSRTIPVWP